eukprot:6213489-Pleurochrysis_carterae.AAC.1
MLELCRKPTGEVVFTQEIRWLLPCINRTARASSIRHVSTASDSCKACLESAWPANNQVAAACRFHPILVAVQVSARRDPSGVRLEHNVVKYKYPADHDIVYVTTPTPVTTGVNPPVLPEAEPPVVQTFRGQPTAFGRSQYVRRGQRCGDIGWGCYTVSPMESDRNGLRECARMPALPLALRGRVSLLNQSCDWRQRWWPQQLQ